MYRWASRLYARSLRRAIKRLGTRGRRLVLFLPDGAPSAGDPRKEDQFRDENIT